MVHTLILKMHLLSSWGPLLVVCAMPVWVGSTVTKEAGTILADLASGKQGCVDPGNIEFGRRSISQYLRANQKWSLKSVIKYTCEAGYVPVGGTILTCSEGGVWVPPNPPKCVTEIDYPPTSDPGKDVDLTWPVNYVVLNGSGSSDDRAIVDYQWTLITDNLSVDMSGTRSPILNLRNLEIGQYTFNLKVTDISGQSDTHSVRVTVRPDLTEWSSSCGEPPELPNSSWDATLVGGQATEGTYVYYTCKDSYHLVYPEAYRLQCMEGRWVGLHPSCVPAPSGGTPQSPMSVPTICPEPEPIENGYARVMPPRNGKIPAGASPTMIIEGQQMYYFCENGFQLKGQALRECRGGEWTGFPASCIPVCGVPPSLEHGDYNFFGLSGGDLTEMQLPPGSRAFYFCHDGFQFSDGRQSGSVELVCSDGRWEGDVPTCVKRTHCDPPQEIQHGSWVFAGMSKDAYKYALGTKVLYECDRGYQPFGAILIECESTGYWSYFPPKCLLKGMYCEQPGDLDNGYFVCLPNHCGMYKVGVKLHYVCKSGYEPQGEVVSTCLNGGVWEYSKPTCVPVTTTPVAANLMDINSNTMTVVIATSCTVLGLLLLVMVVVALQRRKPGNRLCHPVPPPAPPYSCPRPEAMDEHDRVALIAFADGVQVVLPSYEEAVRSSNTRRPSSRSLSESGSMRRSGPGLPPGEYRPLPSIPHSLRGPRDSVRSSGSQDHHRNSIITNASSATRDNLSLAFGSMDTVNASDATSTSVTIETYDSAASNPSIALSQRAAAGSLASSNGSLANEDAPLITEPHTDTHTLGSRSQSEQSPIEEEKSEG